LTTVVATPAEETVVGYDPVTGRNQEINFTWEELCFSREYQVQIAKDAAFTLMVFDSGVYAPPSTTAPAMLYLAGGRMEAGHSYFWRARVRRACGLASRRICWRGWAARGQRRGL
jgi:hypothetical protein